MQACRTAAGAAGQVLRLPVPAPATSGPFSCSSCRLLHLPLRRPASRPAGPGSPRAATVDLNRLDALLQGADLPSEDEEDEDYE